MVQALNFGGGEEEAINPEAAKKTREERLQEIMEKSKAFKFHAQQVKEANAETTRQLDEDWNDVAALLKFKTKDSDVQANLTHKADEVFDDVLTKLKTTEGL